MNLKGKGAIVTGAARRVGRAIALALAERGADVVVHYHRSEEDARETVREIEVRGVRALAVRADLGEVREIERLIEEAVRFLGHLDVLVNNASVFFRTPFGSITEEQWDLNLDVNLKAPFFCAQYAARVMQQQGGGKIINIADWAGFRPYAGYIPYCVSKAGLIALTQVLAKTLAPTILVNAVAPGPVLLPEEYGEEETRAIIEATPLKRLGSPEDVARAVLFLIEGSDFITGHTLVVDGGRLIGS
ncbi:MAG: glucose 1-dehydrogenase [Blastocatellia bacterium]|nr:glucose 1-dehydrogenase [Blastocatellia bacterium]MCS7157696.1 glucose 1-dehydrogenase [Blastocatellia bacterium]MCX7751961.1 glucose 1-dehydrogenase [Blastocatellia bacterium]MDW8167067.1 glucose 1-dehydrogenase [Acidobacteriota bacterium]MDW8257171.1 glucose 1-dehydrogenase [Acidobacteriota bacterium]